MKSIIINKLNRAFELTRDLAVHLDESALILHLKDLPSNSIGEQFWCIIGARESYLKAAQQGKWAGFTCSLKDTKSKQEIIDKLSLTQEQLNDLTNIDLDEARLELLFDLLEHEIQHHGQLIRYVYGNELTFPVSWHTRYTV